MVIKLGSGSVLVISKKSSNVADLLPGDVGFTILMPI